MIKFIFNNRLRMLILSFILTFSQLAFAGTVSNTFPIHTEVEIFGLSNKAFTNSTDASLTCYIDKSATQIDDAYKLGNAVPKEIQQENPSTKENSSLIQKAATKISKQYYKELEMAGEAFYCIYEAKTLGVKKLPAIVFDKKYVVYGETNVGEALENYKLFKGGRRYAENS